MLKARLLRWWLRATSLLPLPVAHGLGAALGLLLWRLRRRDREVAEDNIQACFPGHGPAERAHLVRASFRELGKQIMESGLIWYAGTRRLEGLVANPEAIEELEAAWPRDGGLLVAAPHLGNWELANLFVNRHHRLHGLYRPPRQAWLEPVLVELRARTGGRTVPAGPGGLRHLLRKLRERQLVGILPDQVPREGGVHAPFFGVPARTMTLLCQMARKTGAGVVFVFMERLPRGQGFRLHVLPGEAALRDTDPAVAAAALNRSVEACVRIAPAQYQWTYRRFRKPPAGQPDPYRPKAARRRQ